MSVTRILTPYFIRSLTNLVSKVLSKTPHTLQINIMKFTRTVMMGRILRRNVITVPKSLKGFGKVCWAYPEQFQRRTPVSMRGSYEETACHSGEESFQMEKSKMVLTSLSYPSTPSHSATYRDGSFIQDFSGPIIFLII